MTKEEYEQCKVDQYSDDPYKALQARFILSMFPTHDTKYKANTKEDINAFVDLSEKLLKISVLQTVKQENN